MQPARAEGAIDRRAVDLIAQQLCPADNAGLVTSDCPNCFGFSSVSDGKAKQLEHAAMVGAPATPPLHAFASTQPKNQRVIRLT
jgi:hypothetical protein